MLECKCEQLIPLLHCFSELIDTCWNVNDTYTDEMITEDLKKFESVIVNLAVYDHSQAGENYMASMNEGGVNRTWRDRDSLFVGVFPFAKVL